MFTLFLPLWTPGTIKLFKLHLPSALVLFTCARLRAQYLSSWFLAFLGVAIVRLKSVLLRRVCEMFSPCLCISYVCPCLRLWFFMPSVLCVFMKPCYVYILLSVCRLVTWHTPLLQRTSLFLTCVFIKERRQKNENLTNLLGKLLQERMRGRMFSF